MNLDWLKLKILDIYLIKKVLGAYFLSIVLVISIAVVFDFSEKIDTFATASFKRIVMDYYLNFIPYFANLFSPLFTFIAVIFITSKLADDSEIIAMFSGGISFHRVVKPYMYSAAVIAMLSFFLSNFVIPPANKVRLEFLSEYKNSYRRSSSVNNVQLEIAKGEVLFVGNYDSNSRRAYRMSLEKFDGKTLVSRTTAQFADYDSLGVWHLRKYVRRDFVGMEETLYQGECMDTTINCDPSDFFVFDHQQEQMSNKQLRRFIERQKSRGVGNVQDFEIELAKRYSSPFAAFVLTLIGFAVSSRKVKGGMGINLGIGLLLSFAYIMFDTVSASFAVSGMMSPWLAVWIPNLVFAVIAAYMYKRAPK
ncbi:MAG: LptF/LptG family permease [Paludibacteraceae bacterium]|nr:LptF/LptG family permease [Paludibacteraceae bacterium]